MVLLVAEPLVLAVVTGGEGVDGAILSRAPMTAMRTGRYALVPSVFLL